jgi:hypothetical protein
VKLPALIGAVVSLGLVACAASSTSPRTISPSPSRSPSAAPSPTASATADDEQVSVTASGVGDYDLQAIPVAVLHNVAGDHTALSVQTAFAVRHPGGVYDLDAPPVSLAPGEVLAVAALCTDACRGATGTTVTVTVGSWTSGGEPALTASAAAYACGSPCAGNGGFEGDASGTVTGSVAAGTPVDLFAACSSAAGTIVGGGITQTVWTGTSNPVRVSVPVLVTAEPRSCALYGAVG